MTKKKMIRKLFSLLLVLVMSLSAQAVLAEAAVDTQTPASSVQDETEKARENAIAAMKVSLPEATLNYTVRERDDGRYEWNLFFTQGTSLGVCKVIESSNTIRKVEMFDKAADTLTADKAVEKLIAEKGQMTIRDLELDWDDGRLCYEGEAEMNGKRYEFEMTASGRIVEWERD